MLSSALGFILTRRWKPPVGATTFTAWQLTFGGMPTLPIALCTEGVMPPQPLATTASFAYIILFASIIAYACWFTGVPQLPDSSVSIIGLLNRLTGLLLGTALADEPFSLLQLGGCTAILARVFLGMILRNNILPPSLYFLREASDGDAILIYFQPIVTVLANKLLTEEEQQPCAYTA